MIAAGALGHGLRAAVLCGAIVAAAGCGGGGEPVAPPAPPPGPSLTPTTGSGGGTPRGVPEALRAGGGVAVIDLSGRAGARPREMEIAKDASLSELRWRGWGGAQAAGSGRLRLLDCDPTCAEGQLRSFPAKIVLGGPRTCGAARFYASATVTYRQEGRTRRPAAYLQAPC